MRVLLQYGFALEFGVECVECADFRLAECDLGLLIAVSVACLEELDRDGSCLCRDGDELEQAVGGGKLTVFEFEPLSFEHAEQLFDDPALLVPVDHAPTFPSVRLALPRHPP